MIKYLSKSQVAEINKRLILEYSENEIMGIKDHSLLELALNRPRQSVFGEDAYKTIYEKAAALFHSLVKNHAFHNANKRTALTVLVMFLYINEIEFSMGSDKAEDFVVDVANDRLIFKEISEIIRYYSTQKNLGVFYNAIK